jgi:hypothetical protein
MSEEKCCGQELKCPYCSREFKSKSGLIAHMKTCKAKHDLELPHEEFFNQEVETKWKEVEDSIPIEEEPQYTEYQEPSLNDDIKNFFNSIGARPLRGRYDIELLFGLFKRLHPKSTLHMDYTCSQCVSQIYKRVMEHYEKIK